MHTKGCRLQPLVCMKIVGSAHQTCTERYS